MADKLIATEKIAVPPDPWVSAEELADACCGSTPVPPCETIVEPWKGYTVAEVLEELGIELDADGRNADGDLVEIRLVRPKSGICGEKETTYVIVPQNCCDGVSALAWDTGLSVTVLAPESGGVVGVTGGKGPYVWKLTGSGVTFDHGLREISTPLKNVWLTTGPSFCGSAVITVTDVCGNSATGYVKSTVGQWVLTGYGPCHYPGCGEFNYYVETTCIRDNYKVVQLASSAWSVPCSGCTHEEAAAAIAGLCSTIPSGETPCFDIPSNWYPCGGNNNYWTQSGSSVLLIQFSLYKAYEWKC